LNRKAQLQLEAAVCIAVFFSLIALSIAAVNVLRDESLKEEEMLIAEAKAVKCSCIADSLFSNSGGKIRIEEQCYSEGEHEITAVFKGEKKKAFSVAEKVNSNQVAGRTTLEVGVDEHYR